MKHHALRPGALVIGGLTVALAAAVTPAACQRGTPDATPTPPAANSTTTPAPTASASAEPTTSTPAPPPTTTTTAPRSGFPPSLAGRDITVIPTNRRIVALTFDAGANADGVAAILATLRREHITATFFLTGAFVDRFPSAAQSIAAAGHRLGNHSVTHPHFPALTASQLRAEVAGAEQRIKATTGKSTKPLFRFPFGDRTAQTVTSVNNLGYVAVRWTVDTLGWQGTSGGRSSETVTQRVLGAAQPGEIVLMHVGSNPTDHSTVDADALPGVIAALRERGFGFVTLDALINSAG